MRRSFAVAAQWLVLTCLAGSAAAADLFAVQFPGPTPLYSVNEATGALTAIGDTSFANVADLTSDPLTGTLWGIDVATNQLLTINRHTGAASLAAQLDSPTPIASIAFDPVTRRLFGNTAVGFGKTTQDTLYAIDPSSGSTTLIGPLGVDFSQVYALGFDQHGVLFGIADSSKQLIMIDPTTGAGAMVGNSLSVNAAFDLASRPSDNTMFLADSTSNALYKLNTADGVLTEIGPYGGTANIVGLAFLAPAPEPSVYLALAAGLALLALARRRLPH